VRGLFRKVVLIVVDGLRPDAVTAEGMPVLHALMRRAWRAEGAVTVRPSVTVAALTSLATGVSPARHRITEAGLRHLPRLRGFRPLPLELKALGVETTIIAPELPGASRFLAGALLRLAGANRLMTPASAPGGLVDAATQHLEGNPNRELVVVYLNDADLAGHAWGWMSRAYRRAADVIDRALARIVRLTTDQDTLIIVTADHGGGGVLERDHDHPHPTNDAIPLMFLGGRVAPGCFSSGPVRLLDIPPTVLHGFGGIVPAAYEGRVVHEAFAPELVSA
jgi:arylsulfatase A-like enzyme